MIYAVQVSLTMEGMGTPSNRNGNDDNGDDDDVDGNS